MEPVGAALHGDDDFGGTAELGGDRVGDDGEFLHRVESRIIAASPATLRHDGAVEDELRGIVKDAVKARAFDSRQLAEQVAEAAAVDRQLADAFAFQRSADCRIVGGYQRRNLFHFHCRCCQAGRQRGVDDDAVRHADGEARLRTSAYPRTAPTECSFLAPRTERCRSRLRWSRYSRQHSSRY